MGFYTNTPAEDLDHALSFLAIEPVDSLANADLAFIDLEAFIFNEFPGMDFTNHKFTLKDLCLRFEKLIKEIPEAKKNIVLFVDLKDVKSTASENIFWWSYYNHKFTASKGKDIDAMNKWHELEDIISVDEIAMFKQRREVNLGLCLEVVKKHLLFKEVIFAGIDGSINEKHEFGLDIAEEAYLLKMIDEHQAHKVCQLVEKVQSDKLLNLTRLELAKRDNLAVRFNVISNSKMIDPHIVQAYKKSFFYLNAKEAPLKDSNLVLLINDLDLLSNLPFIDTENPIVAVDFSATSSPNFGYILLKDEGFNQVYSYAKKREKESAEMTLVRSLSQGMISYMKTKPFVDQIAINYMDDFFKPLAGSIGKSLKEFSAPINLLAEKLEFRMEKEESLEEAWEDAERPSPKNS
jgi:hypothetical protein